MPSFYIPLSGLDADSTALNTIANNLANMNTTGYNSLFRPRWWWWEPVVYPEREFPGQPFGNSRDIGRTGCNGLSGGQWRGEYERRNIRH